MLMAATIVFGIVAASRIGISQFPDVDFPNISVSVAWEGAAPEVIENDIVEVLEEALVQVEGMRTITSYSRMGSASITLELDISRDVDFALQDVQAKVSQAQRRLPRYIAPPTFSKSTPEDQPILFISLAGPFPQRVLSDYVRYSLKEKLQTIPGVGEITMMGAQDRNVRVWLAATTPVRRIARVNGVQGQGVGLKKQRGANAVAVARKARAAIEEFQKTLPEGMTAQITMDSTKFIEDSVREIQFELILSVLLTALGCWMFLGSLSSTLNVILAIPMSLMGTMAIIYFLGFTFNTFTLLGMALAVGIVVDDAIMVMENIFRHREGGKGLVRAALGGTREIAFAALGGTLAVGAIFVPVVFSTGG